RRVVQLRQLRGDPLGPHPAARARPAGDRRTSAGRAGGPGAARVAGAGWHGASGRSERVLSTSSPTTSAVRVLRPAATGSGPADRYPAAHRDQRGRPWLPRPSTSTSYATSTWR